MKNNITRRDFMRNTAGVGLAAAAGLQVLTQAQERPVRIGFVGTGDRGTGMLRVALGIEGVEIPAGQAQPQGPA